ncbi:putative CASP8-associated protein 2 [Scophthalmus maximus]|uniref:CASP8-associated protein 2 n=1 Tax=Scophthalmus maximus TaxID=52904 RepID=A0A2U9CVG7_SCOMX|nr:CASP8-associated protein 2 isoform X2 [Scophthalmus maximus]AWP19646.1 putative CASP8-associated protein 2 [Scophthalmus maximus]
MENLNTSDASGLLVPDVNEDSVDIYDDLDVGFHNKAEKSPSNASQLKESMDLYEELVTEEQQSKETSYTELKSRFQAAQNQIKELHRRLEQVEMQNTGLNTENYRLKKNICALLQTARQEVTRKDAEIQRLNQWSVKGRNYHQPHINNLRDQNSSCRTSTGSSSSRPPPPPSPSNPPPPPPPPPSSLQPPPPRRPTSPPRENQPSRHPPQSSRTGSNSNSLATQPIGSCIETQASKASSHSHSKSSLRGNCEIPDKQTGPSVSKSSSSSSGQHSDSDKHKSKGREGKYPSPKLSESTERRSRGGSYPNKDGHFPEKNRSHKADKDTGRKNDSRSCKSRSHQNVEGHHRSDRTEKKPLEGSRSSSPYEDTKGRSRERKQDKAKLAPSDSEQRTTRSKEGYVRDHRRIKNGDGHRRSSDSKDRKISCSDQSAERHADSPKEREGERVSKDRQRKDERRREDEVGREHKRSNLSDMNSEKKRSKESDQGKVDVRKDRQDKTHEALKRSSEDPQIPEKNSVEENSPNRKLCFMETLNLTLSPIKKPVLPTDASQGVSTTEDKLSVNRSDDENLQFRVEDMCVIDEVDCSGLKEGFEEAEEQSSDVPEESSSEKTHQRSDSAKDVVEKDESLGQSAAGKLLEGSTVQISSAPSQPLDTAENQRTVHLTPKPPESSSLKETEGDISNSTASDKHIAKSEPSEATDDVLDTPGSVSKQHTSNYIQKVNPGNSAEPTAMPDPNVLDSRTAPKSLPMDSFEKTASPSRELPVAEDDLGSPRSQQIPATSLPQECPHPPAPFTSNHKKAACHVEDSPKDTVSSTISLESLPQEGLSLPEAIYVLTQTNEETNDSVSTAPETSSSAGCIAVSKVSSTTEETLLPENPRGLTFTPKKSFSPEKSHKSNVEPTSSVPLFHDEDSMMRTLSNLKRIPDAISPLRSPIRITKRSLIHVHGKPGHVKSLQKDFSSTAVDVNSKRLDVNKENKYPGSPAKNDAHKMVDKVSEVQSCLSETDLEEGEILSESDEAATSSPVPAHKRAKLAQPVRNKPSPKSLLKRKSEESCASSKESSESPSASTRSPKSRFKTVCPAATKSSFSTTEEIMKTFKLVRSEIRKKYMKLHKTFPKKSFYGMMENFQESFLEFVDGAHFGQICSQAEELKSRLKKLIASVFSKVLNNGIVKRIFEQQAVDLKQKLWDFVDVQVECLFKDVHETLKNLCKPARAQPEEKRPGGNEKVPGQSSSKTPGGNEKVPGQSSSKTPQFRQKETQSAPTSLNVIKPCAVVPYKTGLGSRGKDIRITHVEKDCSTNPRPTDCRNTQNVIGFRPPKNIALTPEKNNMASLVVSQSGSLLDKTDFELLTEQQASSLTFNLVRDSQMGEIFKCLLQGSDLLETSGITGDSTSWSLGTPRKDGERLISITTPTKFDSPSKLLSPTKFNTPSKLITTWSSISPRRMMSPRTKDQIPLNPALFDENCLLELPSENKAMLQTSLASQRSFSILAEDLAVSLTIPSPLKSDSHLSFLQPSSMHIMSTPDSVISAHISEDALLDGEDATEQDIHLALDTDNSSCGSSGSLSSAARATSFLFRPDVPMQALVMEKSNDHFIVKICQTATCADITLTADDSLSQTLTEEDHQQREGDAASEESQATAVLRNKSQKRITPNASPCKKRLSNFAERSGICQASTSPGICLTQDESLTLAKHPSNKKEYTTTQPSTSKFCFSKESKAPLSVSQKVISPSKSAVADNSPHHPTETFETNQMSRVSLSQVSDSSERDGTEVSESESPTVAEDIGSSPEKDHGDCDRGRKRKKRTDPLRAKRRRRVKEVERTDEMVSNSERDKSISSPASLSPNSVSAKNVVRKKGEVVIAWSRDEDRAILIELKKKGASRETFSALSEKLDKPSGQIAHRFHQLMKLFKKQEKVDT